MSLNISAYERNEQKAVAQFWATRATATARQQEGGKVDQGERAGVTAGKNMDAFIEILINVARDNGLTNAEVCTQRSKLTLPGYYRPTKNWDLLILNGPRLVAAVELKSQVGPSFGNNFNNRAEEAIGTAHDFWTAYREKALGEYAPRPFVGWIILVEDCPASRVGGLRIDSPHFNVFSDFREASYLERYEILCRKLMVEGLYTCAALVTSPRDTSVVFDQISDATNLRNFITTFASYCAAESTRST